MRKIEFKLVVGFVLKHDEEFKKLNDIGNDSKASCEVTLKA